MLITRSRTRSLTRTRARTRVPSIHLLTRIHSHPFKRQFTRLRIRLLHANLYVYMQYYHPKDYVVHSLACTLILGH